MNASPDGGADEQLVAELLAQLATCSDTAASETSSSAPACLTEPSRTTAAKARSCVGVILRTLVEVAGVRGS